jgi:type IV pilus assembly protein PilQ
MKRLSTIILLLAAITLAGGCTTTAGKQQIDLGLTIINSVDPGDHRIELQLSRETPEAVRVVKTDDPYTVIVEMPEVARGDISERVMVNLPGIVEVRFFMVQTPQFMTRMEILMDSPLEARAEQHGVYIMVNLFEKEAAEAANEQMRQVVDVAMEQHARQVPPPAEMLKATMISEMQVVSTEESVRFVAYGDGVMEPDIFTLNGRIIIDVPGVAMRALLPEEVTAPVRGVRYGTYRDKVRIVLDMDGLSSDFEAATEDNTLVVTIPLRTDPGASVLSTVAAGAPDMGEPPDESGAPMADIAEPMDEMADAPGAVESAEPAGDLGIASGSVAAPTAPAAAAEPGADELQQKYTGEKITLDFQDADIVPIFRFIGDIADYNVVIHPSVSGKITLKLRDVPWDQALDIILELSNLDKNITGNILRIAPPEIFVKQQQATKQLKDANQQAAELVQRAIALEHISVSEMRDRINEAKLLSPRGTIRIDERTNTLIINDTEESIRKIRDVEILYWDSPEHGTMQVLIEAKIISVRTDYTNRLGIRWGGHADNTNFSWVNDASNLDFSVNTPVGQAGSSVATGGALVSVGYSETFSLNMSLEALETVKKARSLANPRVITIDKQQATISQGTAIPYTTSADGGGTKVETQDATLNLTVTPEIRPNGIVLLDVSVNNDSPTLIPGADAPGIDKQQIKTKALVRDGDTLVLGGIFTSTEDESEVRVPFLAKLPIIGWLFKTREISRIPNELLIFITPKIIQ